MSARILASRSTAALTRRPPPLSALRRFYSAPSTVRTSTGGLLRPASVLQSRGPRWPGQFYRYHAIVPATRQMSFARSLPKLVLKFARVPAAFGGVAIAGLAYVQYKAEQAGSYALGVINQGVDIASTTWDGAKRTADGVYDSIAVGLNNIERPEMPEWMHNILQFGGDKGGSGGEGAGGSGGGKNPNGDKKPHTVAAGAATAAAFGYGSDGDNRDPQQAAKDDQMMVLTKKMIEIRNILSQVGQMQALQLPSIVVIGSQSSGKSSVLEAIVGHEFLPKGSNMVTRRPIELTLVNTPGSNLEYGEFPSLGLGRISDFTAIQRTLMDLNLAVPEEDCVSDDPIQLTIYSPNVPDLSLIDLPGYIQVAGEGQPTELKSKIAELCEKYIKPPNVILAISAADVDLANSTALKASRRVDPRGERTIGVVTKMDLVEPERGQAILKDKNYPLRLGYVGVVCRTPSTGYFFGKNANITNAISKNEHAFFNAHPEFSPESGTTVGTINLRQKLMTVLEQTMASSLQGTSDAIHQELEEATYEFKVQYNDRPLTAETYLAESLDRFKHSFKGFTESFGRPQVRELLKHELDQKVLDFLAQRYWNKPLPEDLTRVRLDEKSLAELPKADADSLYWHRKLDASTSSLTKMGFGRLATNVVANALAQHMERLVTESTFREHPFAKKAIQDATNTILNERFYSTSDQVENCIKPFKYEIEMDDREWTQSRENAQKLLKDELKACEEAMKQMNNTIGKKKLNQAMSFIDKIRDGQKVDMGQGTEAFGFSQALLEKGREALFLRDRAELLKMRMYALKSKQCTNKANKYYCPEIFLDIVAEKLTSTAVLFLNVELLSEFYYHFPRELDNRLGRHLSPDQVEAFAREDPKIRKHIDLQQRKQLLELALEKMESLMALEKSKKHPVDEDAGATPAGRWGRFF
ncbi:P-loop containing nucleoside triphosphate hydrolase protein [Sphaerosporella brunnea]|uniref:dynamin GTPase n=1 Tax=Sphaerosporella brunnea TaxID=1250544 RepID=A0A5J5F377_9PEZI|nr:P-loop containing nucleoside triphosphate hydrolase protein [Sphaerosporella brunnea]